MIKPIVWQGDAHVWGLARQRVFRWPQERPAALIQGRWRPLSLSGPRRDVDGPRGDMSGRVLVIDDDEITRELFGSLLRKAGHKVWELPSPIGATRMILTERIDVAVLDVFMPEMDGDKSAKMLRENPRLQDLSLVLASSCSVDELRSVAARVRADGVVSKADARTSLVPVVQRLLARRRPGGDAPSSRRPLNDCAAVSVAPRRGTSRPAR